MVRKEMSKKQRMYLLARDEDRKRFDDFDENEERQKSLDEEVKLSRIVYERILNIASKTDESFLGSASLLLQASSSVERLVKANKSLQVDLGSLLNKKEVMAFGDSLSGIIVDALDGVEGKEEICDVIFAKMVELIAGLGKDD